MERRQVDSRGISLRFPRFLKVRDDKNADEATTAEQVSYVPTLDTDMGK
jgi:ATP-dependent DNA ligase